MEFLFLCRRAAFYPAVANEGARPRPHAIDSIEVGGRTIYQYPNAPPPTIAAAADHTSFYQLKTMLQGVVACILTLNSARIFAAGVVDDASAAHERSPHTRLRRREAASSAGSAACGARVRARWWILNGRSLGRKICSLSSRQMRLHRIATLPRFNRADYQIGGVLHFVS
jgi:hypothetical protein